MHTHIHICTGGHAGRYTQTYVRTHEHVCMHTHYKHAYPTFMHACMHHVHTSHSQQTFHSHTHTHTRHLPLLAPGPVRPARPDRCLAAGFDTGMMLSDSMPVSAEKTFCFTAPQSITNLIPGTVMDVSAMFVATTSLRVPVGGSSNTRW